MTNTFHVLHKNFMATQTYFLNCWRISSLDAKSMIFYQQITFLQPSLLTKLLTCKPWVCMFVVFGEWKVLMGSLLGRIGELFSFSLFICKTT